MQKRYAFLRGSDYPVSRRKTRQEERGSRDVASIRGGMISKQVFSKHAYRASSRTAGASFLLTHADLGVAVYRHPNLAALWKHSGGGRRGWIVGLIVLVNLRTRILSARVRLVSEQRSRDRAIV